MPIFRVPLQKVITAYINVKAEDEELAYDIALEHGPEFCAQCQGWGRAWSVDADGDWEESDGEGIELLSDDEDTNVVNDD